MTSRLVRLATLRRMLRHSRATRTEIIAFQSERLRHLVAHAYEKVPYYRKLFDAHGLRPEHIRSVGDLHRIPVSSKTELQASPPEEVLASDADRRKLRSITTSGSTGRPFTVWRGPGDNLAFPVLFLRARRFHGIPWRGRAAFVNNAARNRRRSRGGRFGRQTLFIDCTLPPEEIKRRLLEFKPDVISGFPTAIALAATLLTEEERERIGPRMIFTASEVVTPLMRAQITTGFHAPMYDTYNCWELGHIASEGREPGHYAIADDAVVVEVLRDDGQPAQEGEAGELVGTNLHFHAMPFIRYRLGDIVTRGAVGAVAGLPFSTLRAIQGRTVDYFRLSGGRLLHPCAVMLTIHEIPWIRQYQLVQETETRITARIVPHSPPSEQELEALRELIRVSTGGEVRVVTQLVPEIAPGPNGKFRAALSHLHSYYEGASLPSPSDTSSTGAA